MKTNKWTVYKDSVAKWNYEFPPDKLRESGLTFDDVIRNFLRIGEETQLIQLCSVNERNPTIEDFMLHFQLLKKQYPYINITNRGLTSYGKKDFSDFFFSTRHFFYNREGEIGIYDLSKQSSDMIFKDIEYPVLNRRLPILEFTTGRTGDINEEITETIDFTLYSDIWVDSVPCLHCEHWDIREAEIDEVMRKEGVSAVVNYWSDNGELATLNREILNSFMAKMNVFLQSIGGRMEPNTGELSYYEGKLTPNGIFK